MKRDMEAEYDIIVLGGGLVGSACTLALQRQGLKVALVERGSAEESAPDEVLDDRIYAITPGNAAWLRSRDVWQKLESQHVCPIDRMQVHGDTDAASIDFDADEAHVERLGYIVESKRLQQALWNALRESDAALLTDTVCAGVVWQAEAAALSLADGRRLAASLLVAADGADSWLRMQAGIEASFHDYGQMGVVANFASALPHGNTARQWFRDDDVLAWLPLPGQRISMVWSTATARAEQLLALNAEGLAQAVAVAGGLELGTLEALNAARAFP